MSDFTFDAVMQGKQSEIAPRLATAAKSPREPQVIELMLTILKNVPWTADSSKPLWRHVFGAVAASKSPRFVQEADAIRSGFTVRPLMKSYLENQFKKAIEGLPKTGANTPAPAAPAKKKLAGAQDESALLAAVYASPGDDAPRQVYADFLMERGDPRGEFISLQLSGSDPKTEKKLLKAHGKEWLGAIAAVLGAQFEFRRGFLSKAVAKFRHEADARKFGDLPDWSTVEELSWSGPTPRPLGQAPFIDYLGPTMISLKKANEPHGPSVLAATRPFSTLEELSIALPPMKVVALLASKNFPRLHTLHFAGFIDESFFRNVKSIGAVKHFSAGVALKDRAPAIAAAALQHGFESVTLSGQVFDQKSKLPAVDEATPGLPALHIVLAIGTRPDGAVIVVDQAVIYVFDAALTTVLEAWPTEKMNRSQITPDGSRVISTRYRQLVGFDTTSGATLFDISIKELQNHFAGQQPLSADMKRLSLRDVVIDLETTKEIAGPRASNKAMLIDPDQQWWCTSDKGQWVFQRLGFKGAVPLAPFGIRECFSHSSGVLHYSRDEALTSFDLVSGAKLGHFDGGHSLLAYSSDGSRIALSSDDSVLILDARTLAVDQRLNEKAFRAAFSPDDTSLLITRSGQIVRVKLALTA